MNLILELLDFQCCHHRWNHVLLCFVDLKFFACVIVNAMFASLSSVAGSLLQMETHPPQVLPGVQTGF